MSEVASESANSPAYPKVKFFPREHGATAMLFTPIFCAAILARQWHWTELATLTAAFAALAAKDPMVVLGRQIFVWKQRRAETTVAAEWFAAWMTLLLVSGLVLLFTWPIRGTLALGAGVGVFSLLAILVNVKNRQRSTLFQIVSAFALTSSSLATSLSATGAIQPWCWRLWVLLGLQATTGILIVHARLDARIAARKPEQTSEHFRRAAVLALLILFCAAVTAAFLHRGFIALALLIAIAGYAYDLRRQRNPLSLQMPLIAVGQQALALSSVFAVLLILGLW